MSLNILNAHTGASLRTTPRAYNSLDELRAWISLKFGIQAQCQILMTARGKQVKLQTLQTEQDIFLYDRSILASSNSASKLLPPLEPSITPFSPSGPPRTSDKATSLYDLQNRFRQRRAWAQQLYNDSKSAVQKILQLEGETDVVQHGVAIAVDNIRQHIRNLKPKQEETKAWADQICEEQVHILAAWRKSHDAIAHVAVQRQFARCLRGGDQAIERADARTSKGAVILQDFVEEDTVLKASAAGEGIAQQFRARVADLQTTYENVIDESESVLGDLKQSESAMGTDTRGQASHLLEEIEVLSNKIASDEEQTGEYQDGPKALSQASKTAQFHKNNLIPSLMQTSEEIAQMLQQTAKRKQKTMKLSIQRLQRISLVESQISLVHSKLARLDMNADSGQIFDLLHFVINLPATYGIFLVEYVRRCEWAVKIPCDASAQSEDMVARKEEEMMRRNQRLQEIEGLMEFSELGEVGIVTAHGHQRPDDGGFLAGREDVSNYIDQLRQVSGLESAASEVSNALKTQLYPLKQQGRPPITFRNASLHEATYGRDSVTLQRDGQALVDLRIEKSRVDEKLKSAESRIRKLEDLLHRQSQAPRPSSSSGFGPSIVPTFERHATSPVTTFTSALSKARDVGSRRSSTSSRRVSQNLEPEEKSLAQRIVNLEAELIAQKAQSRDLEKNAAARLNAEDNLKSQAREAIATKEDLLGNLEAQQHEFENERRLLEEDRNRFKLQVEDLEDELERIHYNNMHNDDFYALQDQHEKLKQDARGREEALRHDLDAQRERFIGLEQASQQQIQRNTDLESAIKRIQNRLHDHENAQAGHHQVLRSSLVRLSDEGSAGGDFDKMLETLETVARKSVDQQRELRDALETIKMDNAALEARSRVQDDEVDTLREQLGEAERRIFSVRDELLSTAAECASLRSELQSVVEERDAFQSDSKKLGTDTEALRQQLSDSQLSRTNLNDRLADLQGKWDHLSNQMLEKEAALGSLRQQNDEMSTAKLAQATRADDISKRFKLQDESLRRLLEQVGFIVTKQEDSVVIQKVSKAATSASTVLNDASVLMKRSVSSALPTRAELEVLIESESMHWATAKDPEEAASLYGDFIASASAFDVDAFNEAIYKRIKDVEHIARKWQREARAYRDKAHRAQSEAHERISLRSFKEGDLALFLPTRDQATKPWAAFNVGAPHYFLREHDSHKLAKRDWLIARISKVEERMVDLSKSMNGLKVPNASVDEENPYELSDGLRWYLLDAAEEKPGAPINIGTGKATVALAETDKAIKGSIGLKKASDGNGATKTLTRSLDSRRSSTNSKKGLVAVAAAANSTSAPPAPEGMLQRTASNVSARIGDRTSHELPDSTTAESGPTQEAPPAESAAHDQVSTTWAPAL